MSPQPFAFSPLDPALRRDPYALYARGRREHPVYLHEGLPLRVASVFRYADVQAILRDDVGFSNSFPLNRQLAELASDDLPPPSMLGTDGEEHARLRGLVNKAFTPRIVRRLEPRMREIARELAEAAAAKVEVDLVQALTYPLPVAVIAEVIGIPGGDRAQFKAWSDEAVASLGLVFFGGLDRERAERQGRLLADMREYLVPLAEERARSPREDLLTGLVQAEHEGSHLSYDEMIQMVVLLLVAGNETTTTLIGNAALEILARPELEARLRAEPARLEGAIEEVLRFSSPVQFDPRRVTRAVELHGVKLEPDDYLLCWLGSANRDEAVFERAEEFDPERERIPHLAFGFGAHFCIGSNLARLEARVALEALLAATKGMERAGEGPLPLHPSPVFRGVTSLPVRLY
jgi:cytochrome P450